MTPRRPFPNLTSIATVSISGSLPEKLEAAAQIGFEAVEIFENDLLTFDGTPREIRELASNLGLEICIFQPFRDFEALPEPMRGRNMDRAERKFDLMQALGSDLVLVCSNTQPATIGDPARGPVTALMVRTGEKTVGKRETIDTALGRLSCWPVRYDRNTDPTMANVRNIQLMIPAIQSQVTDWYCPASDLVMRQEIDQGGQRSVIEVKSVK